MLQNYFITHTRIPWTRFIGNVLQIHINLILKNCQSFDKNKLYWIFINFINYVKLFLIWTRFVNNTKCNLLILIGFELPYRNNSEGVVLLCNKHSALWTDTPLSVIASETKQSHTEHMHSFGLIAGSQTPRNDVERDQSLNAYISWDTLPKKGFSIYITIRFYGMYW
jgi:hypothetical protein